MNNQFDLERARAGEPLEYFYFGKWVTARFLGLAQIVPCQPIIEYFGASGSGISYVHNIENIRMAPKKVTVRYRVALCQGAHSRYVMAVQEGDPEPQLMACGFIDWLDEWKSVEVPQGGE